MLNISIIVESEYFIYKPLVFGFYFIPSFSHKTYSNLSVQTVMCQLKSLQVLNFVTKNAVC